MLHGLPLLPPSSKLTCHSVANDPLHSTLPPSSPMENPNPIPNPNLPNSSPNPNPQKVLEALIETLLSTPDLVSPSGVSLALEQGLLRHTDVEKVELLKRSLAIGSYLQDAASRLWRQHDSFCNSLIWPLTQDLTIKVFSLLDVHSLCQVAASCSLFNKAAMEPACYREIDLMDHNLRVDNNTVAKIIQRSGQHLRSLKLGLPAPQNKVDKSPGKMLMLGDPRMPIKGKMYLSKSCLEPLVASNGAAGALLQTLHLHNIAELDSRRLCKVIAVCPGLLDLEVVGLHVNVRKFLHSVTSCCHSLMRLCIRSPKTELPNSWISYSIRTLSCNEIVHGCPKISSLLLRGFKLPDQKVKLLLKGLHHLLEVDFSGADLLTGSFLRDLVVSEDQKLKSLKLRDCLCLRAAEVKRLLSSLSTGECKSLRHVDVSNKDGLVSSDWGYQRSNLSEEILSHVRKDRPELDLHADFPDEKSSSECDSMSLTSSFGYSEYSEPLQPSFHSEDILSENTHSFRSTSSIDTDQDSDDEDADEFEVDSDDHDENEDEDEDTQFLSPCDYSEGEDTVFHMDNGSPSDAGDTGPFLL